MSSTSSGWKIVRAGSDASQCVTRRVLRSHLLRRLFNAQWCSRLRAWWIVRRPAVVQFIDRMLDAYGKYGRGRRLG